MDEEVDEKLDETTQATATAAQPPAAAPVSVNDNGNENKNQNEDETADREATRCLVSIERIVAIRPHKNADMLDLATILGWQVVVTKGMFNVGDLVLFYRIDSILPIEHPEYAFLFGLPLKTKRIRDERSQGLVGPLTWALWHGLDLNLDNAQEHRDLTADFKITKVDECEEGRLPFGIPKTRESRVQDCPRIIRELVGQPAIMTRKQDGCSITFAHNEGQRKLCSRSQDLYAMRDALVNHPADHPDKVSFNRNSQHYFQIEEELQLLARLQETGLDLAIQGELCGPKITGNRLQLDKLVFWAFKIWDIKRRCYWSRKKTEPFLAHMGVEMVPIYWRGTFPEAWNSVPALLAEADKVRYDPVDEHPDILGEGFVCMTDTDDGELHHSFKVISNDYLMAHDSGKGRKPRRNKQGADSKKNCRDL